MRRGLKSPPYVIATGVKVAMVPSPFQGEARLRVRVRVGTGNVENTAARGLPLPVGEGMRVRAALE